MVEEVKKEEVKEVPKEEVKEEPNKEKSGIELGREQLQKEIKKVEGSRKAYDPNSLKTKVLDPGYQEKKNDLKEIPSSFDVYKKEYLCKKCGKGHPSQREALNCYNDCWEYGRAVKAPRGFKVN